MSARPVGTWLLAVAGVAVLATVVAAMAVIGSPAQQRQQRFDEQRVQALERIETAIDMHVGVRRALPDSLDALRQSPHGAGVRVVDPQTGAPFGYSRLDARRYELCADFVTARRGEARGVASMGAKWAHPAGRHCFELETSRGQDAGRLTLE